MSDNPWTTLPACEDCGDDLATLGVFYYDGAMFSCLTCHALYQVSADSEGMDVVWRGAPCFACGALTDDGGPCAPSCDAPMEERSHAVIL
jgi:hypothetical protein